MGVIAVSRRTQVTTSCVRWRVLPAGAVGDRHEARPERLELGDRAAEA